MEECQILFTGRVQGVGFRYTTKLMLDHEHARGFVRNLEDGRVELRLQGSRNDIERLIEIVRARWGADITKIEKMWQAPTATMAFFDIK